LAESSPYWGYFRSGDYLVRAEPIRNVQIGVFWRGAYGRRSEEDWVIGLPQFCSDLVLIDPIA